MNLDTPISDVVARPDTSFDGLRKSAVAELSQNSGERWTDHNFSDPGITMLETALFTLSSLEVRAELLGMSSELWSFESRQGGSAHWTGLALPEDSGQQQLLADALHNHLGELRTAVEKAPSRHVAISNVNDVLGPDATRETAGAVVRLLRARTMMEALYGNSGTIDTAFTAGDVAQLLTPENPLRVLWNDELDAVTAWARRRDERRSIEANLDRFRRAMEGRVTEAEVDALSSAPDGDPALVALGSATARHIEASMSAHELPPERYEAANGETLVWPPHPSQVIHGEPTTNSDYAVLARRHSKVTRAWVVNGRFTGVDYMGRRRLTPGLPRLGGTTILVEGVDPELHIPLEDAAADATRRSELADFQRNVLSTMHADPRVIGDAPAGSWPDDWIGDHFDFDHYGGGEDSIGPRRLLGDELSIASPVGIEIVVKAKLTIATSTHKGRLLQDIHRRVDDFFSNGRPESQEPEDGRVHVGPWPTDGGNPQGWNPGEAIRIGELTQLLVANDEVLGAEDVSARRRTSSTWHDKLLVLEPLELPHRSDHTCISFTVERERNC